MNEKIVLTLTVHTPEQAAALVEAYGEIVGLSTERNPVDASVSIKATPAAAYAGPVPTPGVIPPASSAPVNDTDDHGVPFHADLHAPKRTKTKDGAWMLKKGADKTAAADWAKRHARPASAPPAPPAAPGVAPAPAMLNATFGAPPVPAAYPPVDYQTFGTLYQKLATAGKINAEHVAQIQAATNTPDAANYVHDAAARAHAFALLQKYDV